MVLWRCGRPGRQCSSSPRFDMCKLCVRAFLLVACLAAADAFFLPVFVRSSKEPQTPAVNNNLWNRSPSVAPVSYRDYQPYNAPVPQLQPVPMASMQQYTYETPTMMNPFHQQMQLQPQFHNVQLVPCMCPLTRDVIEQQAQNMMQSMQTASQHSTSDSTKLGPIQENNKTL